MRKKYCYKCNKTKEINLFSKNQSQKDGLSCECKKCRASFDKKRRTAMRQFIFDIYKNCGGCVDCGESNIATLQFDHVKGKKTENISFLIKNSTLNKIKKEISKCEIVCANCHAIRTSAQFNWYANIK